MNLFLIKTQQKGREITYLFKKNLFLGKSLRPVMIYCHPIRPEKIGQFNVNLRVKLSGVLLLTPTITPYVLPLKLFLYYFKSKTTFL